MRDPAITRCQPGWLISILGERLCHGAGKVVDSHCHADGQLSIVLGGTMTIMSEAGWWLAPPGRGIWIPPSTSHSATYSEASDFILLKINPEEAVAMPSQPLTMAISPLLRELAIELLTFDRGCADGEYGALVSRVALDQMRRSKLAPVLFLPAGQDRRLRRVTEHLRLHPDIDAPLQDLARWAGSSPRTIARLFQAETGMTFAQWRDHLRIVIATDMLVRGSSIIQTALDLGFRSQSSFTTMFTRVMGMPPGRFIRQASKS